MPDGRGRTWVAGGHDHAGAQGEAVGRRRGNQARGVRPAVLTQRRGFIQQQLISLFDIEFDAECIAFLLQQMNREFSRL